MTDEQETRWRALHAQWLAIHAEWAAGDPEQGRADQLMDEESRIVLEMVAAPMPPKLLRQKLEVLDFLLFHDRQSPWSDRRDELLLNSIKADVKALS